MEQVEEIPSLRSGPIPMCRFEKNWSGREDLNLRPPGPEPDFARYGNLLKFIVCN